MKNRYYTIRCSNADSGALLWRLGTRVYEYFGVLNTRDYTEFTFACDPVEYIIVRIRLLLNGIKVRRV